MASLEPAVAESSSVNGTVLRHGDGRMVEGLRFVPNSQLINGFTCVAKMYPTTVSSYAHEIVPILPI